MCKMRGCMKTRWKGHHTIRGKGTEGTAYLHSLSKTSSNFLPHSYCPVVLILWRALSWWSSGGWLNQEHLSRVLLCCTRLSESKLKKTRLHNGGIGFIYFVLRDQYPIKQLREWQQETGSVLYQMTLPQFLLCKRWSHGTHISLTQTSLGEPSSSLP